MTEPETPAQFEPEDARALLQSLQTLRTHWSGVITSHVGYALIVQAAIWSFFGTAFIEQNRDPEFLLLGGAISAFFLGIWRIYSRGVDNVLAGLYPSFLFCEDRMNIPREYGTSAYLRRDVPHVGSILNGEGISRDEARSIIRHLVNAKKIGNRGHFQLDCIALGVILIIWIYYFYIFATSVGSPDISIFFRILTGIGIAIGTVLTVLAMCLYQRNPTEQFVEDTIRLAKNRCSSPEDSGGNSQR